MRSTSGPPRLLHLVHYPCTTTTPLSRDSTVAETGQWLGDEMKIPLTGPPSGLPFRGRGTGSRLGVVITFSMHTATVLKSVPTAQPIAAQENLPKPPKVDSLSVGLDLGRKWANCTSCLATTAGSSGRQLQILAVLVLASQLAKVDPARAPPTRLVQYKVPLAACTTRHSLDNIAKGMHNMGAPLWLGEISACPLVQHFPRLTRPLNLSRRHEPLFSLRS
jgi:hypothetical protein